MYATRDMRFPKAHPVPQSADWVRPSLSGIHNLLRSSDGHCTALHYSSRKECRPRRHWGGCVFSTL